MLTTASANFMYGNGRVSQPFFQKTYASAQNQSASSTYVSGFLKKSRIIVGFLIFCLRNSTLDAYSGAPADAASLTQ